MVKDYNKRLYWQTAAFLGFNFVHFLSFRTHGLDLQLGRLPFGFLPSFIAQVVYGKLVQQRHGDEIAVRPLFLIRNLTAFRAHDAIASAFVTPSRDARPQRAAKDPFDTTASRVEQGNLAAIILRAAQIILMWFEGLNIHRDH